MNRKLELMVAALLLAAAIAAVAGRAHEHGVARLDVGVEADRVSLLLEVPLDSLLGFEREPRTDAERAQAAATLAKLRDAGALFRIDPAAHCKPGRVDLRSAALGLGDAAPANDGHADLDATFDFSCKDGNKSGFVEVHLFEAFPRLQRLDVQTATRRGQMKATLVRPVTRLPLAR
jgi:hypothetical protein